MDGRRSRTSTKDQAAVALSQAQAALAQAQREATSQIAAAQDRVTIAKAALADAKASGDVSSATRARDNARAARDQARAALAALQASTGPTVPQGEVVFVPALPARVQSAISTLGPVGSGAPGGAEETASAPSTLVTLAGGQLVVEMTARPAEVELLRAGMAVEILDERTDTAYAATISSIAEAPTPSADGQVGYPMVVTPDQPLPAAMAGTNVRVTVTAASTEAESLVVPLAAVSAAADGSTRVSVLAPGAVDPVDVAVSAGLSADGFVAVEPVDGEELEVGDLVVVGR